MQFPARFSDLPEYAFPRLRRLLDGMAPGGPELAMTIGEPKHPLPEMVAAPSRSTRPSSRSTRRTTAPRSSAPPSPAGSSAATASTSTPTPSSSTAERHPRGPVQRRHRPLPRRPGTARPAILMPNPFYQAYGAAALAVGAEPVPVPATAETGFLPDYAALPPALLDRVTLCYLCSPVEPAGRGRRRRATGAASCDLAERHDFRILADECYAEIYRDTPPPGALEIGRRRRRRPRARGDLPLALQALQRPRPARRLRRRRPALHRRAAPAPRLRRRARPPAAAARRHRALAGRGPRHAPAARSTREKFALADRMLGNMPGYRSPAGRLLPLAARSATARPSRSGSTARPACGCCPAATSAAPRAEGPNPGAPYVRVALVAEAAEVERGLGAIRETLAATITQEKVE